MLMPLGKMLTETLSFWVEDGELYFENSLSPISQFKIMR